MSVAQPTLRAYGLEWQTTSPPIPENFLHTPIVTQEAYDYASIDHSQTLEPIAAD